jgi:hypothetical protein
VVEKVNDRRSTKDWRLIVSVAINGIRGEIVSGTLIEGAKLLQGMKGE